MSISVSSYHYTLGLLFSLSTSTQIMLHALLGAMQQQYHEISSVWLTQSFSIVTLQGGKNHVHEVHL